MKPFACLLILVATAFASANYQRGFDARVGGRISPSGTPIQIDLPGNLHLHNVGGSDGAGLCVFTSCAHSARWQNIEVLKNFRDYMRKFPGGGWPEKVDTYIKKICAEKGVAVPRYMHVRTKDLGILQKACATGRMPAVTYCFSPTGRYGGGYISHMVNLAHADSKEFAVLDNNYEGETNYEWMSPDEFSRVWSCGGNYYWAIIFLDHGPPPSPIN